MWGLCEAFAGKLASFCLLCIPGCCHHLLFGKGTAEQRALPRNDKLMKPWWRLGMAAEQQGHPNDVSAQSL